MHNQIQKQIRNNTQHISHHLKNIRSTAILCQQSLDIHRSNPGGYSIPIHLIQDLHHIIDTASHAIHLAQLNNSLHRIRTTLPNTAPTPDPTPDPPPYRPSSPHLTTTPATLIN